VLVGFLACLLKALMRIALAALRFERLSRTLPRFFAGIGSDTEGQEHAEKI
jgi:hypothetical protein